MDKLAKSFAQAVDTYHENYKEHIANTDIRAIVIGCVDSRVIPEMMFDALPGEIMTLRVAGGLVPPQGLGDSAVTGALELAVNRVTNLESIIVLGHTDCLMLKQMTEGIDASEEPGLARWSALSDYARAQASTVADQLSDYDGFRQALLEATVIRSVENLREIPTIREKEASGQLQLLGWYYDLHHGVVAQFNPQTGGFESLNEAKESIDTMVNENPKTDPRPASSTYTSTEIHSEGPIRSAQYKKEKGSYFSDRYKSKFLKGSAAGAGAGTFASRYVTDPDENVSNFEDVSINPDLEESVAPDPVYSESVEPGSVAPPSPTIDETPTASVEPGPVDVGRGNPVQRVYPSDVSRAERGLSTDASGQSVSSDSSSFKFADDEIDEDVDVEALMNDEATAEEQMALPENVQEAMNNPALDDLREILGGANTPTGKLAARQRLNEIRSPQGWRDVAQAVNELRDPEVRQALNEVAFEIRSPAARRELRKILSGFNTEQVLKRAQDMSPNEIKTEFQDLINKLRDE